MIARIALSPRFGDFVFVKRAWNVASFHGLVNRFIEEFKLNKDLQLLRSQIIQRISFVVKATEDVNAVQNGSSEEFLVSEDESEKVENMVEFSIKHVSRITRARR